MARFLNAGAMPIEHRALNAINYVARAHLGHLSSRRAAPRVASAARVRVLLAFASCPPMRDAPISAASVAALALPSGSTWSVYLGAPGLAERDHL
jgi:hypothetical protein